METLAAPIVVLTTCRDEAVAARIARDLVESGQARSDPGGAACVSRVGPVHSTYRWQGAIQDEPEVLLVIKTVTTRYPEHRDASQISSSLPSTGSHRLPDHVRRGGLSLMATGSGAMKDSGSARRPRRRLTERLGFVAAAAVLLACCGSVLAGESGLLAALGNQPKFLPADQVFHVSAVAAGASAIRLDWTIRDGYYLYRTRLKVTDAGGAALGPLQLPAGQIKMDPYFGREEIYRHEVSGLLPFDRSSGRANVSLRVTYQGCADAGLCYPPITKTVSVSLPAAVPGASAGAGMPSGAGAGGASAASAASASSQPGQFRFEALARSGSLLAMIGWFYLAGLGLAFTGCVYPTIPILSGIIVGQGRAVTTARAFVLSLAYVLGMALTYTIAGTAFAAAGGEVQAAFQKPWIIASFAALFVAMALSMLGLFTVQMPAALQTRIAQLSNRQTAGSLGGVAAMGALSALIVTTCVGPALVGALAVISQTGQMARGAAALFAMSIGMGTPLLVVGTSAGRLMPKSGAWMDAVKKFFGAVMLGVAVWMLARLLPPRATLALWAVPAATLAAVLWTATRRSSRGWPLRIAGLVAGLYGLALVTGAALGGTDPLAPIPAWAAARHPLSFTTIHSVADLDRAVAQAAHAGRPVMVDFYADWCTSCKEMEATTFLDPAVRQALAGTVLLRADVTANDANDRALLKRFGIYGPPTIAFYGREGRERSRHRVVGYMGGAEFAAAVRAAIGSGPAS
jgi:thiol:disulfide interchange protein DsbD